jgi:hypothetical protein
MVVGFAVFGCGVVEFGWGVVAFGGGVYAGELSGVSHEVDVLDLSQRPTVFVVSGG